MGYRDDFYIPENIVGYTGNIDNQPTVYFQRIEDNGTISFGHITQYWYDSDFGRCSSPNVGREEVRNAADYIIGNVQGRMEESAPSINFYHPSRNPITLLDRTTKPKTRYKLSLAIASFTVQKHWERYEQGEKNQFIDDAKLTKSFGTGTKVANLRHKFE
jgi:hypothetical protein